MKKLVSLSLFMALCLCAVMALPSFADDTDSEGDDPAPYAVSGAGDTF